MKKIYVFAIALAVIFGSSFTPASAQSNNDADNNGKENRGGFFSNFKLGGFFHGDRGDKNGDHKDDYKNKGVFGTVTALSGNTITVTGKENGTVYTIDATNAKIDKNKATIAVSGIAVGDMVLVEGTVNGASVVATSIHAGVMVKGSDHMKDSVSGTVTAISGTTITVSSKGMGPNAATTAYTVNASNAKVERNGATSSVSAIIVGDQIKVKGTISGTTVTATEIKAGTKVVIPEGNGQPIVGGTVTAISGTTITITNKSNVSYTIDAKASTFIKSGKAGTISDIAIGDTVLAQGTVNGTSITAVSVTDQGNLTATDNGQHKGFFKKIGSFFSRIFGF